MVDTSQILRRVFKGLQGPDLETLCQVVMHRSVPAGTVLCREGEIEHELYIICSGSVSISKRFTDEQEYVLAIKGAGDFVGEMALVENKPRTATVTTLVDTELLVMTEDIFDQVVARNPVMALSILQQVSSRLRHADRLAILDLERKNRQLRRAYQDLHAAHEELVEKKRLERELEIAAEVQRNILPNRFPTVPGFSFAACAHPARHVGGDFYDVRWVAGKKLGVLMADVCGKSVHAAIYMAVTRGLFMAEALHSTSPSQVMYRVHELLANTLGIEGMFVTAFYAVIEPENGRMRYARAGHDRPLHYRRGQINPLPGEGRFIGLFERPTIEERELQLQSGDMLVLFSDGVTDALSPKGEQFGIERLSDVVRERATSGAQAVCDAVFARVRAFQDTASQFDDITLQIIAYQEKHRGGDN